MWNNMNVTTSRSAASDATNKQVLTWQLPSYICTRTRRFPIAQRSLSDNAWSLRIQIVSVNNSTQLYLQAWYKRDNISFCFILHVQFNYHTCCNFACLIIPYAVVLISFPCKCNSSGALWLVKRDSVQLIVVLVIECRLMQLFISVVDYKIAL